jgi:hypothetical protein
MKNGSRMMKVSSLILTIPILLVLSITSTACAQTNPKLVNSGKGDVSWAKGWTNLSDLVTDSPLIVIGEIVKVKETIQQNERLYFTKFFFRVDTVLKGQAANQIVIYQTGTPDKPETGIMDDPLFKIGDKYLLFLESNEPDTYCYYGPECRYLIATDKVYSINHVLDNTQYIAPRTLDYNGFSLAMFNANVKEILNSVRFYSSTNVTRLLRGEAEKASFVLATNNSVEGKVLFNINRVDSKNGYLMPVTDGMTLNIVPNELYVHPNNDYHLILEIQTDEQNIVSGEYLINVNYNIGGTITGSHQIKVIIDTLKLSDIKMRP